MPAILSHRQHLYETGLSDNQIAIRQGVTGVSVWEWRKKRALRPNFPSGHRGPIDRQAIADRPRLYAEGWTDTMIAAVQNVARTSIRLWRVRKGLPSNSVANISLGPVKVLSLDWEFEAGGNRHEKVADPSWSNWLEEMGATVW